MTESEPTACSQRGIAASRHRVIAYQTSRGSHVPRQNTLSQSYNSLAKKNQELPCLAMLGPTPAKLWMRGSPADKTREGRENAPVPSTMTSYSFAISSMMGDSWRRDDAGEEDGRVKAVVVYVGRRRYESRRGRSSSGGVGWMGSGWDVGAGGGHQRVETFLFGDSTISARLMC